MPETVIERQLAELFKLEQQLHVLLEKEQYEQFQQQQAVLSSQIKVLVNTNPTESLNRVLKKLQELEKNIAILQSRADACFEQLKNKSLLQKRNKNRLKAYK
jgi:tetrahydrodipicolinate N-succinyltransferase